MDEEKVLIARVRRVHGLEGEVLVESLSDFPERFAGLAGKEVFLLPPGQTRRLRVMAAKPHGDGFLLRFEGVGSREEAEALGRALIGVPREEAIPLGEGEYYAFQLVGLEVVTTEGLSLGRLREVHHFPANDVYEVRDEATGRELLLPAVADVVREVDLERGIVTVALMAGMLD